jgi:DNA-binding beta-propeller fold protein YncE
MISLFEYNEKQFAAAQDAPSISTVDEFFETSFLNFIEPTSVATGPNGVYFYVVDQGIATGIVQKIDNRGNVHEEWGSKCFAITECFSYDPVMNESESIPGKFGDPTGIAVDLQRNVYIVDRVMESVQKFNDKGEFIGELISDNRTNGKAFAVPQAVAIDGDDNFYVADSGNYRIVKLDATGGYVTDWGSRGIRDGQFGSIDGIAVDFHLKQVYVSDSLNQRIQVFDTNGNFIRNLVLISISETESFRPKGLSVALQTGDLYVIDTGIKDRLEDYQGTLQKFSGTNGNVTQLNLEGLTPKSIAVDTSGKSIFVAAEEDVFLIRGWGS